MEKRSKIDLMDKVSDEDEDDDMDEQGNFMELGMEESDEDDDGEEADEDDDDEDDDDDEGGSEDEQAASWGTRKRAYYSSGSGDEEDEEFEDSDEEAAINEEAEVKRLQKKRAQERSEADFADAFSVLAKKPASRSSASALAADLHEGIHADLQGMDQDGVAAEVERVHRDISQLTKAEKLELIQRDAPELLVLMEQFKEKIVEIKERIQPLIQQLKAKKVPKTSQGLSYLEVKYHLLLSYCINISFYLLLKSEGRSVKNHPVIEQLVRTRVLLEKMRPLDQRLKYQIDKLLKMATLGEANVEMDPKLKHKPNLRAFAPVGAGSDDEEDGADGEGVDSDEAPSAKYRAPKLSATVFDDTEKRDRRRQKAEDKARKSSMAQFLVEEFDDQPLSRPLTVGQDMNPEQDEDEQERIRYEEETFQRKLVSKKDRKKRKRTQLTNDLAELDDFSDLTALTKSMTTQTEEADAIGASTADKSKRQQQLAEVLNSIENQQNKAKRPKLGAAGDTDIPYLDDLKKLKTSKKTAAKPADDDDNADRFISFKGSKKAALPDNVEEDDDGLLAMPSMGGRGGYGDNDDDDFGGDSGDGDSDAMEAEDYYANVAAASAAKKAAREEKRSEIQSARESSRAAAYAEMEQDEMDGGKRKIDRMIEKNTGLSKKVQAKKAKDRNPRVKRKVKYQDALKRRKGAVQELRDKTQKYGGEQTGIKSNVVRSVKLS
eukprot:TRINITY_DN297_c0_g1_i2.p1 TRINITY_DN297_c0_g1~~TRINITY_DN297_c0_g1_i2.p1  ORF type:complete len:717 (+),score=267.21 TRINITY_DN297_c0_g1_i2:346-2496(+)